MRHHAPIVIVALFAAALAIFIVLAGRRLLIRITLGGSPDSSLDAVSPPAAQEPRDAEVEPQSEGLSVLLVESTPPGAPVYVVPYLPKLPLVELKPGYETYGWLVGVTPFELKREAGTVRYLVLKKEGFADVPLVIPPGPEGTREISVRLLRPMEIPEGMVYVPAGDFLMGSDDASADESPRHVVHLPAFFIDRTEVTNAQYARFIEKTVHRSPRGWSDGKFPEGKADYPVTGVSWEDARAFAEWSGKRLPTEAEWEKAARGADGRKWPWGDEFLTGRANTVEMKLGEPAQVASFPLGESPYGCFDMAGNVWEWTGSCYVAYPGNCTHSRYYGEEFRVVRGGSFEADAFAARCTNRYYDIPNFPNDTSLGFRCARDLPGE